MDIQKLLRREPWWRRATESWRGECHTRREPWRRHSSSKARHTRWHTGWSTIRHGSARHGWRGHPTGWHHSHSTPSRHTTSWASGQRALGLVIVPSGWRTLDTNANNSLSPKNDQSESPLQLLLNPCVRFLGLDASELFAVCENQVHVLVKCKHLSGERAAIV